MLRGGKKTRHELLPLPSLNFPCFPHMPHSVCGRTGSTVSWGQAAAPSCCASLTPPLRILLSPAPPRTRSGSLALSPVMVPFQRSPPARSWQPALPPACAGQVAGAAQGPPVGSSLIPPHGAPHSPLCPNPATYAPNPHCQQNARSQGCCNFRNHTVNPFSEPAKRGKETARSQNMHCPGIS